MSDSDHLPRTPSKRARKERAPVLHRPLAAEPHAPPANWCLRCSKNIWNTRLVDSQGNVRWAQCNTDHVTKCEYCSGNTSHKPCEKIPEQFLGHVKGLLADRELLALDFNDADSAELAQRQQVYTNAVEAWLKKEAKLGGTRRPASSFEVGLATHKEIGSVGSSLKRLEEGLQENTEVLEKMCGLLSTQNKLLMKMLEKMGVDSDEMEE